MARRKPDDSLGRSTRMPARPAFISQYQAVLDSRQQRFDEYFDNSTWLALHEAAHVRLLEIELLLQVASQRREGKLLHLATKLLADGLCGLACANYQLAFYSLRSFLEFSTAAVKFSAFEFELRQWESGAADIAWAAVSVGEKGVYSKQFASAFLEGLAEEHKHYQNLASRIYRETSEYVHGNPGSHHDGSHSDARVRHWFSLFDAAVTCVIYAFFLRYHADFDFSQDASPEIHAIVQADLGHFPGVTALLSKGPENG